MSSITRMKGTIVLLFGLILMVTGCSKQNSNSSIDPDTGKHNIAGWANADTHGAWAKKPSTEGGFASCQECHGSDFSGGNSKKACSTCHTVNAPHPAVWRTGARTHQTTDESNAPVCAGCHTNGANSPIALTTPAPAGTAPGCFNNTLCHGAGHPAGWNAANQHGASAKLANGFAGCQSCHGTAFSGSGSAVTCLNTSGCHGLGINSPHPQTPWNGVAVMHTNTDTSNAVVCADCHALGANLTSVPVPTNLVGGTPGCFNSTLCHGQVGHPVGWNSPAAHGAAAKSAPSVTNVTGFSTCQTCHAANFTGGTSTISCLNTAGCHGVTLSSPHAAAPWRSSVTSTMTHTTTDVANATVCGFCHSGESNNGNHAYATPPGQVTCFDNTLCHAVAATSCVVCHASPQGTRDAVVGEFGLAWGHKKSGRGAVTDADCIVCHLEGNFATQTRSVYHGDGNIDLRDPDGAGETPITNMTGGAFTFTKFATSYAAGSRTSTGHQSNNVDNVLTQKFCLACHDSNGAANTTARSSNGGTGTAFMPFGGVNLGAGYTLLNGAAAVGGVVDAKTQFLTTNSSAHPVTGSRSKRYPTQARLAVPYNNFTRTAGTLVAGIVMNCFDCHNTPTVPLLTRTVSAHGNANTIRGTLYGAGTGSNSVASPTFCLTCHIGGYNTSSDGHGSGSALSATSNGGADMTAARFTNCASCHFSNGFKPVRPLQAADVHGFNGIASTGAAWSYGNANGMRPVALMRNTGRWTTSSPRPASAPGITAGNASCAGASLSSTGGVACGNSMGTYTPGGAY